MPAIGLEVLNLSEFMSATSRRFRAVTLFLAPELDLSKAFSLRVMLLTTREFALQTQLRLDGCSSVMWQ
eukprot:795508-Amphidinium_carterae.1